MSWDIFVQDLPTDVASVEEIPADFRPRLVGNRKEIIANILGLFPSADFPDTSWGMIEGDDWSIEVSLGAEESVQHFAFHVRGGDAAAGAVDTILRSLKLRALDSQTGEILAAGAQVLKSFRRWRSYRDQICRDVPSN